jgi:molecular chaperone Hsp33
MSVAFETSTDRVSPAGDDSVRPFVVEVLDVRGRAIQMGPALDAILSRHNYPAPVSRLLAEAIVLAVLLGSSLKINGRFTLQTETDGAVDMLVVDYRSGGAIRAYARFDVEKVEAVVGKGATVPSELLGRGTLAMTIDQGSHTSRYQGVVAIDGESLEEVAHTYFRQSEQIPTHVRLAVGEMQSRQDGELRHSWRAGGLIVQFLPESEERMRQPDLPGGDAPEGVEDVAEEVEEDDAWVEARSLAATIGDDELTDPAVPVETLLYRLFHERGVRVFDAVGVRDQCSCSRDKVEGVLATFSAQEITESTEDGEISVTCEFCGTRYGFDPAAFTSPSRGDDQE